MSTENLHQQKCVACEGGVDPIEKEAASNLMPQLDEAWHLSDDGKHISRTFSFKNYYQTMAFANAVAYVAHQEDHHPDMQISYRDCHVDYTTHAIGGLSQNDFICAAKLDRLLIG
ncbi:MAG: 4a-hydroxytetrahydrobiopterin dehydratase [Gammaproteobacteria bacterium]|nr:4a-hydroxytetrahydrobiopterin dehydratase [Gammaproteobacteria bacterium]